MLSNLTRLWRFCKCRKRNRVAYYTVPATTYFTFVVTGHSLLMPVIEPRVEMTYCHLNNRSSDLVGLSDLDFVICIPRASKFIIVSQAFQCEHLLSPSTERTKWAPRSMQGADETHNPGSLARERGKPFTPTISAWFKAQLIRRLFVKKNPKKALRTRAAIPKALFVNFFS